MKREFTKIHRENLSKSHRGKIAWNKGKNLSEKHIKNLSISHLGNKTGFQKGHKINFGKKYSTERRKKISDSKIGEKNPCWRGGISYEPYTIDWNETLKRSIRERDHYVCQICFKNGWVVHHIDYDKKNCNPSNLITLCKSCHQKTNFNRNYWINYFK